MEQTANFIPFRQSHMLSSTSKEDISICLATDKANLTSSRFCEFQKEILSCSVFIVLTC